MRKRNLLFIAAIVVLALTITGVTVFASQPAAGPARTDTPLGPPMGSTHFQLNWNVLGNGGGIVSSSHFGVSSTIGQPTVGFSSSSNFEVCSGFWCKVLAVFKLYLPLQINI